MIADPKSNDMTPRYWLLRQEILQHIASNGLRKGDRLPSERELARKFNLALGTVQKAMLKLEQEGILEKRHGSGTYVRDASSAAEKIASEKSLSIGVLLPGFLEYFYAPVVSAIESAAQAGGYDVILKQLGNGSGSTIERLRQLIARKDISGLLAAPSSKEPDGGLLLELHASGIPMVLFDRPVPELDVDCVAQDNVAGGTMATKHLIEQSCRRICFVGLTVESNYAFSERLAGYREALAEAGIPYDGSLVFHRLSADETEDSARRRLAPYLNDARPDGVFAFNDMNACEVFGILTESGRRIPEDVALIGYDDSESSSFHKPPISSVSTMKDEMGRMAVSLLLRRMKGGREAGMSIKLKPQLFVRDSSSRIEFAVGKTEHQGEGK